MTLQHCNSEVQRNFYRELWSTSREPIAPSVATSKPSNPSKPSLLWTKRALTFALGAKVLGLATTLACQVITQVTTYLNVQNVLIF